MESNNILKFPGSAISHIDGGGGGGYDEGMESRIAKLEASSAHIERDITEIKTDLRDMKKYMREDFRLLFSAIIAAVLGLAAIMAKGFHWI